VHPALTPSARAASAVIATLSLAAPLAVAQTQAPAAAADNALPVVRIRAAASAGERPPAQVEVTRSGAAVLDTPQTINVISAETAQQQGAQTIGDVVRNSASARPSNYFGTYESVYTRGFWMTTTSNYLRNGYPRCAGLDVHKQSIRRHR
jgi:outer membrane receptor for monomeric catechols